MKHARLLTRRLQAAQQPDWDDPHQVSQVRNVLAAAEALVSAEQIAGLRHALELAAQGRALVLQAGDCAEHPGECTAPHIAAKAALVHGIADALGAGTGLPVVRVGRIAGQFAKPRSQPVEQVGAAVLPAYRGHMVNAPEFDAHGRRPDPLRMLMCFMTARETLQHLGWRSDGDWAAREPADRLWTSHEALLVDYERPQVRTLDGGRRMLGSTHWPWIGERTRQLGGAHVDLLSRVVNPVGCKVGPGMTPGELLGLCRALDPDRSPGRLTLIVRMGADAIGDRLPALVRAVRDDGHPVLWMSDPMHGNTVRTADGTKTRVVSTVVEELRRFLDCLRAEGVRAHGVHLEASPYAAGECVGGSGPGGLAALPEPAAPAAGLPSLCDPRLDPAQAMEVVSAWSAYADTGTARTRTPSVLTKRGRP